MVALLPPLLVIFGLLPVTAIRLSALVALVLLGRLDGIYLWRRSSVFGEGMDLKLTILYSIAVSVDVAFGVPSLVDWLRIASSPPFALRKPLSLPSCSDTSVQALSASCRFSGKASQDGGRSTRRAENRVLRVMTAVGGSGHSREGDLICK